MKSIFISVVRAIGLSILGLLSFGLVIGCFKTVFGPPLTINDISVVKMSGILSKDPEMNNYSGRSHSMRMLFKEFPNRSFNVGDYAFDATKHPRSMVRNLHAGDTVFMEVGAEDYNNNIKDQPVPDHIQGVDVYSIKCKGRDWLTLTDYCVAANSNKWAGVVGILFFGFVSLVLCGLLWQKIKAWRGNMGNEVHAGG